jgi:hypothetical protein
MVFYVTVTPTLRCSVGTNVKVKGTNQQETLKKLDQRDDTFVRIHSFRATINIAVSDIYIGVEWGNRMEGATCKT